MYDLLFYALAALTLVPAALLIVNRNTVNSAFLLILAFIGVAGMFFLLEVFFLGVLQVLVYAGAVVVLFLFVIMLLDIRGVATAGARLRQASSWLALPAAPLLLLGAFWLSRHPAFCGRPIGDTSATGSSLRAFGEGLFTRYLLPVQVAGFLLLAAMVGVIVLSRRLRPLPTGADAPAGPAPAAAAPPPDRGAA